MLTDSAVVSKLKTLHSFPENLQKVLICKFRQLGLFSDETVDARETPMRTLSALLEQKCQFQDGEVDIVLLQHTFEIERADGKLETITSTLEAYGDRNGGHSAMARLVGVPCGVAVQLILDGKLTKPGVHAPYDEEVGPLGCATTIACGADSADLQDLPRRAGEGGGHHHG